jgi:hypothetical protein
MRFLTHITAVLLGYVTVDCRVSPNIQNTAVEYQQSDLSTADAGNTTSETASKKSTAKKRRVKRRRSKIIKANPAKPSTPSATNFVSKSMSTMKNAASSTVIAARQNPATVAALTTVLVALLAETTGITNIREYVASLVRTGAVDELKNSPAFTENVSLSTTDSAGSVPVFNHLVGNAQDIDAAVAQSQKSDCIGGDCEVASKRFAAYMGPLLSRANSYITKTLSDDTIKELAANDGALNTIVKEAADGQGKCTGTECLIGSKAFAQRLFRK